MRGGASMAVWIGGAVAEINNLRTAVTSTPAAGGGEHEPDEDHPWSVLAGLAGYDSVDVDVLAGTSAGGLNSVLLASSVVYGMRFDAMRRTWVRLADLEAMARPVPRFWHPRPPSLLEGDAYFRGQLARAIVGNLPRDPSSHAGGSRMDLLLTATLLDPVLESHFDGRAEPIVQQRRRATFRFRHRGRPGQPLSDFGAGPELPDTARKLAQAARTTSSFPMAFEPAEIRCSAASQEDPRTGDDPDMYGLFSECTRVAGASSQTPGDAGEPHCVRVIDGGVLDNIPVTAAIHSVADAKADRPTDRWLLYLNPDPASPREAHAPPPGLALPVAGAALRAKMGQESLLADIDALDEHNRAVERTRLRRAAALADLSSTPPHERHEALAAQVAAVRDEHALVRAQLDAGHVHHLLTEPDETNDRPLLEPVGGDPLAGWSPAARTALREHLDARFAVHARDDPGSVFSGVRGLLSAVEECLAWAQGAETGAPRPELGEIGRDKARLYRLRTFTRVVRAHADRYWTTGARLEPITQVAELDGWVDRVAGRHSRLQHASPVPLAPILGSVLAAVESDEDVPDERFQERLAEFSAELGSIVGSSGADASPDGTDGNVDVVDGARQVLHRIADRLAANTARTSAQNLGHTLLRTAAAAQRPAVLHQLVVLTAPVDVGRALGSHIKFLRVVSDARTPLPFLSLLDNGRIATPDKVRGSGLGNFAAFLSAKWRANDWMWGRLDSATSLVPLLVEPGRLLAHSGDLGADGLADALENLLSRPTRAELGRLEESDAQRWRQFLAERWAEHADDVRGELDALFARPEAEHPLTGTCRAVTERLHWMIAAGELPFVDAAAAGADPTAGDVASETDPARLRERVHAYSVGKQRWRDLDEQRMASVATRFALIGYRASLPSGSRPLSVLARLGAALTKPLLLAFTFAVVAPTRAALGAFVAASAAALSGAGSTVASGAGAAEEARGEPGSGPPQWLDLATFDGGSPDTGTVVAAVLAVVFAAWLGRQVACRFTREGGFPRLLIAVCFCGLLVGAGFSLYSTGTRLGPAGTTVALVLVTWLVTFGYRPSGRVAAAALTGAVLVATMVLGAVLGFSPGTWLLLGAVATAYAHMLLLGTVDVLPPRPRPGPPPGAESRPVGPSRDAIGHHRENALGRIGSGA